MVFQRWLRRRWPKTRSPDTCLSSVAGAVICSRLSGLTVRVRACSAKDWRRGVSFPMAFVNEIGTPIHSSVSRHDVFEVLRSARVRTPGIYDGRSGSYSGIGYPMMTVRRRASSLWPRTQAFSLVQNEFENSLYRARRSRWYGSYEIVIRPESARVARLTR